MFGVSGGELIILLLIGLVVLGPERLPRVANQIGGWLGQARRMTRVMKRQLEEELDLNETLSIKPPPPASREPSSKSDSTTPEPTSQTEKSKSDSTNPEPASQTEKSQPEDSQPDYPPPRDDDEYSPAHDVGEAGTGVGEEIYDDAEDLAVTEADREHAAVANNEPTIADESSIAEEKTSA